MLELILGGNRPRDATLEYCLGDALALGRLLPAMLPKIDLPRALLRGRYMPAAAAMDRVRLAPIADIIWRGSRTSAKCHFLTWRRIKVSHRALEHFLSRRSIDGTIRARHKLHDALFLY